MNRNNPPVFAAVAAFLVLPAALFVFGMWVGQRDAQLLASAERHAMAEQCQSEGAVAVLLIGETTAHDRWHCISGSGRALLRGKGPLASPLASPVRAP